MKRCKKIQWSKLHTRDGEPCCPECGKPAEMVLGIFANPCWAHKIENAPNKRIEQTLRSAAHPER